MQREVRFVTRCYERVITFWKLCIQFRCIYAALVERRSTAHRIFYFSSISVPRDSAWPMERVNFMHTSLFNLSYLGLQRQRIKIYETRKKNVINSIWPKTYKKYSPVLNRAVEKRTHRLDVEARVFFHRETLFSCFCSRSTAASWGL